MDLVCVRLVEEILLCLPAKWLLRLRAVSRRYNAIILSPEFRARYWQQHSPYLTGVFFQPSQCRRPCFLTASRRPAAFISMFASDLAFVPADSHDVGGLLVVNSSAGLLLCSRGHPPVHYYYYICNPQTWQWVALPGLPWPPAKKPQDGLLSVAACGSRFQVVLFDKYRFWEGPDLHMDLRVFSSDDGAWTSPHMRRHSSAGVAPRTGSDAFPPTSSSSTIRVLPVPCRDDNCVLNRCVGERRDGGLRYAHFDFTEFKVWDLLPHEEGGGHWVWVLVHQAGVMDMMPEKDARSRLDVKRSMEVNDLLTVLSFHPTDDDIVFLGMPTQSSMAP